MPLLYKAISKTFFLVSTHISSTLTNIRYPTSTMHVLIAGAGLGGLTLAQNLRKRGISYEIFERDEHKDARFQGWAIALHT